MPRVCTRQSLRAVCGVEARIRGVDGPGGLPHPVVGEPEAVGGVHDRLRLPRVVSHARRGADIGSRALVCAVMAAVCVWGGGSAGGARADGEVTDEVARDVAGEVASEVTGEDTSDLPGEDISAVNGEEISAVNGEEIGDVAGAARCVEAPAAAAERLSGIRGSRSPELTETAARWVWPLGRDVVSRAFERPADEYAAGHRGIDLPAALGERVVAPAAGVVVFAAVVVDRGVLTIRHGDGTVSSFEPITASVSAGTEVASGETVGRVSEGGHCGSTCLHVGARVDDVYVDPEPYFALRRRAVLVPLGNFGPPR